jgi:hypothetical protein
MASAHRRYAEWTPARMMREEARACGGKRAFVLKRVHFTEPFLGDRRGEPRERSADRRVASCERSAELLGASCGRYDAPYDEQPLVSLEL